MFKTVFNHIIHPKKIYSKIKRLNRKIKGSQITFSDLFEYVKKNGIRALISKIIHTMRGMNEYHYHLPEYTEQVKEDLLNFQKKPLISIIMPVYNVDPKWLKLAIKSVKKQWYQNWELCIADDCSTNQLTKGFLSGIENKKIKIAFLTQNLHISGASNEALKLAIGDYYAFMDNDDELTMDALYEVVKLINKTDGEVDFLYSDEDKIELNGTFSEPHYKPDYSPDLLISQNYITHLSVIRSDLVKKISGFEGGLEGSQDYDLILKVTEQTQKIKHIPKVLYHWRKIPGSTAAESNNKNYAYQAAKKAINNALKRRNLRGKVIDTQYVGSYRVKYEIKDKSGNTTTHKMNSSIKPKISIVVPFSDKQKKLKKCINSIIKKTSYSNYEIICISNKKKTNFQKIQKLSKKDPRINFFETSIPLSSSSFKNYTINKFTHGDHIIILKSNIEIITNDWIESMLEFSQRPDVGAVGTMLVYPNGRIHNAGVIIGTKNVSFNSFSGIHNGDSCYFNRPYVIQNLSAVSGACLMVKKTLYQQLSGFNEKELKISYSDIDFCLRLREKGYLNVYTPYAKAYYHKSSIKRIDNLGQKKLKELLKTKPNEPRANEIKRFLSEQAYIKKRHRKILEEGDPYYNPNLSLSNCDFRIKD